MFTFTIPGLPEWWLNLIAPLVTDFCVLRQGGVVECQSYLTVVLVGMPVVAVIAGVVGYLRYKGAGKP